MINNNNKFLYNLFFLEIFIFFSILDQLNLFLDINYFVDNLLENINIYFSKIDTSKNLDPDFFKGFRNYDYLFDDQNDENVDSSVKKEESNVYSEVLLFIGITLIGFGICWFFSKR